jgi:hypothetical protein
MPSLLSLLRQNELCICMAYKKAILKQKDSIGFVIATCRVTEE